MDSLTDTPPISRLEIVDTGRRRRWPDEVKVRSVPLQVQEILRRDLLSGQLFCLRGRSGDLLKVIWHDGQGACLFTKRLIVRAQAACAQAVPRSSAARARGDRRARQRGPNH